MTHNLYIIAGCNGAGKTTASYTILPEMLGCRNFVNADEIARGLSPFQPDTVAVQAGRLMLQRIDELLVQQDDFAIETTLATRSYVQLVKKAQLLQYKVHLLFFWLDSPDLAQRRVRQRVIEGGHGIAPQIIARRYYAGIRNLIQLFLSICDYVAVMNNSVSPYVKIAIKENGKLDIINLELWKQINQQARR